jgi:hypothetical protein
MLGMEGDELNLVFWIVYEILDHGSVDAFKNIRITYMPIDHAILILRIPPGHTFEVYDS